jgi:hypothetical protein
MVYNALIAAVLLACLPGCAERRAPTPAQVPSVSLSHWDDRDWQNVLDAVCTDDGLVRYDLLTNNTNGVGDSLARYITRINQISPENHPYLFTTNANQLAYYINAYNALCLHAVLQESLPANVALAGVYDMKFSVGAQEMSLNDIEAKHLRPAGDPRIHFALNGMSKSSPSLRREPYRGMMLDEQLADQGRKYLGDPRGVQKVGPNKVRLSEVFTHFYPGDFKDAYSRATGKRDPGLLEAIRPFAGPDSPVQQATEYESMTFDWSLNRAR